jgi:hypothetical protein
MYQVGFFIKNLCFYKRLERRGKALISTPLIIEGQRATCIENLLTGHLSVAAQQEPWAMLFR